MIARRIALCLFRISDAGFGRVICRDARAVHMAAFNSPSRQLKIGKKAFFVQSRKLVALPISAVSSAALSFVVRVLSQ